jgi:hypothetical protein
MGIVAFRTPLSFLTILVATNGFNISEKVIDGDWEFWDQDTAKAGVRVLVAGLNPRAYNYGNPSIVPLCPQFEKDERASVSTSLREQR